MPFPTSFFTQNSRSRLRFDDDNRSPFGLSRPSWLCWELLAMKTSEVVMALIALKASGVVVVMKVMKAYALGDGGGGDIFP